MTSLTWSQSTVFLAHLFSSAVTLTCNSTSPISLDKTIETINAFRTYTKGQENLGLRALISSPNKHLTFCLLLPFRQMKNNSIVQLYVILKHAVSQRKRNVCWELNTHAPAWYTKDLWSHEQVHTNLTNLCLLEKGTVMLFTLFCRLCEFSEHTGSESSVSEILLWSSPNPIPLSAFYTLLFNL